MAPEQVPVKCFEVTNIESDAMPFRDRPLIKKVRADNLKEFIRVLTGFQKPGYQILR